MYDRYKNGYVFTIEKSKGKKGKCASGKIIKIDNHEFYHNIPINQCSIGSPIMLLNNNINKIRVIGINIGLNDKERLGFSIFIAKIFANMLTIKFISPDRFINYLMACNDIDNFSFLVEKLFEEFTNLR